MGIFASIGKKNVDKVIGGAISGIDKLFFTKEEKAEFNKNMADSVATFVQSTVGENSIRSITRRFLALSIMGVYLALVLGTAGVYLVDQDYSTFLFSIVKDQSALAIMVAAFYFGGYYAGKFIGSVSNKKKNKTD